MGQTTAGDLASQAGTYGARAGALASDTGAAQANALLAQGNARASAYGGYGQAAGQGLQGLYQNWGNISNALSGYQLGTGTRGNAYAVSQGYEPLNYGADASYYPASGGQAYD